MKSVYHRKRCTDGATDYHHRSRLIVGNHIRIRFGRKNNYYFAGAYKTENPGKPDTCLGYFESRWMRDESGLIPNCNTKLSYHFGKLCGEKLSLIPEIRSPILDIARTKKITVVPFVQGLCQYVKLKHGLTLDHEPSQVKYHFSG